VDAAEVEGLHLAVAHKVSQLEFERDHGTNLVSARVARDNSLSH
jgi:hypothetical protein